MECIDYKEHLCYKEYMDRTIRNIDPESYRELKSLAALSGRNIGDLINEAIRSYLARYGAYGRKGSLADLRPVEFPEGNESLSEEIDSIVYGK